MKTNKLTICLLKSDFGEIKDVLKHPIEPVVIDGCQFFYKDSYPHTPSWVKDFFGSTIPDNLKIIASSGRGLLIVPVEYKKELVHFALTFGTGRHLLKDGVIEDRFGLKVVLNSINPDDWRSIEKTALGSVPKHSKEQMGRNVNARDFGIDIEQDLIGTITAKSNDENFGNIITGKDSLSLSVEADISTIKEILQHCIERFRSNDYKKNFDWIDQIKDIRDKIEENRLYEKLVEKLKNKEYEKIWMAVPEVIDWADTKGFRYIRRQRGDTYDDLSIQDFLTALGDEELSFENLKYKDVFRISSSADDVADEWSVLRCIYAEIEKDGKLFLLSNGKWYEIAKDFTDEVKNHFASMERCGLDLPDCDTNDENTYNTNVAKDSSVFTSLDRSLIPHGGGQSKIEFCDLITNDKRIIHVKRYGGSNLLSHLFSQGTVSGELFVSDSEFRKKVNKILPKGLKLSNPQSRIDAKDYEIVYGIISKSGHDLDLPFFSKVSLRNADRRLSSFGYKVSLKKIKRIPASAQPIEKMSKLSHTVQYVSK